MGQFSPYGPSPLEVTHGTPTQTERFLATALGYGAKEKPPAVYVRNWMRLLEQRSGAFELCLTLCQLWLEEYDDARAVHRHADRRMRI